MCGCDSFYGWSGENCLNYGPGAIVAIVSITVQLLCAIPAFIITVKALYKFLQRFRCRNDATLATILLLCISLSSFFAGRLAALFVVTTPGLLTEISTEDFYEDRKTHTIFLLVEKYLIGISLFFSILLVAQAFLLCKSCSDTLNVKV